MMISEQFASGTSWIHRIDPRCRIVMATAFSAAIAVSREFPTLFTAVAMAVILVILAGLHPGLVARRLLVVAGFVALIWIMLPLTYDGGHQMRLGPFEISRDGVMLSSRITLKTFAILLAFIALVATMTTAALGHALGRMGMPAKMVVLLLLTYRYIFVLEKEYQRLWRAAKVRGFKPGTTLHAYKTYAYLLGMLFVRAAQRAERVHQAMRCRGFSGRFHTLHTTRGTSVSNHAFSALMSIALIGLVLMEWIVTI